MKHEKYQEQHIRVVAGLALLGLAVGGIAIDELGLPIAMAADDKVHPPQLCVPIEPDDENGEASYFFDRVVQTDEEDDTQEFICPVVRDEVTGTLEDVWVRVYNVIDDGPGSGPNDPSDDEELECCVYSISVGASFVDMDCEDTHEEGFTSLHFDLNGFTEYDHGQYVVTCELGYEDRIYGYRSSERR